MKISDVSTLKAQKRENKVKKDKLDKKASGSESKLARKTDEAVMVEDGFDKMSIQTEIQAKSNAHTFKMKSHDRRAADNKEPSKWANNRERRFAKKAAKKEKKRIRRENRTPLQKGLIIGAWAIGIIGIIVLGFVIYDYVDVIVNNPQDAFFTPSPVMTPAPMSSSDSNDPNETLEPGSTADIDLQMQLQQNADNTIIVDGVLNVLLVGVDYADERVSDDWTGKTDFHADVMMILAINFNDGTVDIISLPRDTYAKIPGVEGIYKLNASLDCGGGMNDSGYSKVCEAAEWMLGGIPIDYYYAVTMPIVKRLGDAVGGIDYEVEMDFSMGGRTYKKGMQHLDGQGILDYLRVRKDVEESGDHNRINRQKKMLVALFSEMKRSNKLILIPEILSSLGSDVATNTTLQQTMALTLWALNLDPDNIGMYSMGGYFTSVFGWNFCVTDQATRQNIIREVYGVIVEPYNEYTYGYAHFRWQQMLYEQALKTTEGLISEVEKILGAYCPDPMATAEPIDDLSTPEPTPSGSPEGGLIGDPNDTLEPILTPETSDEPSPTEFTPEPTQTPDPTPESPFTQAQLNAYLEAVESYNNMVRAYEKAFRESERALERESNTLHGLAMELADCRNRFRTAANKLVSEFGLERNFVWTVRYWLDPEFNEVLVDFR